MESIFCHVSVKAHLGLSAKVKGFTHNFPVNRVSFKCSIYT